MGLIRAAVNATMSTMADTWKDYFTCNALDNNTLLVKAEKKGSRGFFNRNDDYITDGSGIVVADGQCMIIVSEGMVTEVCSEPGLYTFDSGLAPSFFAGSFTEGLKSSFEEIKRRFVSGGISAKDSRVYYFNTKEIVGNKFGTATAIPFRLIDNNIGLDVDISIRCNGEYSFEISDPLLFYTNVAGNDADSYDRETLVSQMRAEFLNALQPAIASIGVKGVRYSEIPLHTQELCDELNTNLSNKWSDLRGIRIVSVAINSVSASKEDEEMIKNLQKNRVFTDTRMAAANLASAQADAMRDAARNENGAMNGFMGMGMAMNNGGLNANNLYAMSNQATNTNSWTCSCGKVNDGNFCSACGKPRIKADYCPKCGAEVKSDDSFCNKCGQKLK